MLKCSRKTAKIAVYFEDVSDIERILTIKINCTGTIGVDFFNHHIQLTICQLVVQFSQNFTQTRRWDVAVSCYKQKVLSCFCIRFGLFPAISHELYEGLWFKIRIVYLPSHYSPTTST